MDVPIAFVTGPLGSGKSFFAVREVARALLAGKVVFGNLELVDGWEKIVARHNRYCRFNRKRRERYEIELLSRYLFVPEIERMTKVKIHGIGEGRALLVLDEAHNDLNNRDWASSESKEFLRWLTLARKKGCTTYIISQHKDNTDAGARRIATSQIQVVNYKQITRIPVLDVSLFPFPLFRAYSFLNADAMPSGMTRTKPLWKRWYLLNWCKHLYGTHQMFGELDDDPDAVWLPRPLEAVRAERALRLAATGAAKPCPGVVADAEHGSTTQPEAPGMTPVGSTV
jgi:RecA/RadA recombinase